RVSSIMKELGFDVIEAEHGQDALEQLDPAHPPTAIIADWNMPVMDGVELARVIRGSSAYKDIPFLMISSEADPRRVARAILAGVDEYLFKPVDKTMVEDRLAVMGVYAAVGR
ncbi:MAG: response regulator, partial [Actinomycetia bacterium]|nr:response regulator [Actinomycetes bacterium]